MSDRVVLAPGQEPPRSCSSVSVRQWGRNGGVVLEQLVASKKDEICISESEARHLRDLLCEWFGLPENAPCGRELKEHLRSMFRDGYCVSCKETP